MNDVFRRDAPDPGLWPHVVVVSSRYVGLSAVWDDILVPEVSEWLHEYARDWRLSLRGVPGGGSGLHSLAVVLQRQAHFMDPDTALAFKLRFG